VLAAAFAFFVRAVLPLLVLVTSSLVMLAAFALLFLLLLAFLLGFGTHTVLGLVGVFVCHRITPL
jgi:hypothetical protein